VNFSLALLLALLLLFPGMCVWAALRLHSNRATVSLLPERPNSTVTLFTLVAGALVAHFFGAAALALAELPCRLGGPCVDAGFDPNVYRVLLHGDAGQPPAEAFAWWIGSLVALGLVAGRLAFSAADIPAVRRAQLSASLGWASSLLDDVEREDAVVVGYVISKIEHKGWLLGYEGVVEKITLDDSKAIAAIVLLRCDRFLLKIGADGIRRIPADDEPIELLQIRAEEIANVALEVFRPVS
jgi:hypothetical protein